MTWEDYRLTWHNIAAQYPEFVQWVTQKYGPLPDGPVKQEDYERFKLAYEEGISR